MKLHELLKEIEAKKVQGLMVSENGISKCCSSVVEEQFFEAFKKCLKNATFPKCLKIAKVNALQKR